MNTNINPASPCAPTTRGFPTVRSFGQPPVSDSLQFATVYRRQFPPVCSFRRPPVSDSLQFSTVRSFRPSAVFRRPQFSTVRRLRPAAVFDSLQFSTGRSFRPTANGGPGFFPSSRPLPVRGGLACGRRRPRARAGGSLPFLLFLSSFFPLPSRAPAV